ncbi:MAG: hypothetical protein RLZZ436_4695 [Planctomycetota bacterium]|jgi:hypothetical protein
MNSHRVLTRALQWSLLFLLLANYGCGRNDTNQSASGDDLLDEFLEPETSGQRVSAADEENPDAGEGTAERSRRGGGNGVRSASFSHDDPFAVQPSGFEKPGPKGDRLELNLRAGDRYPLIKTVEQTLVQRSDTHPAMARTRLELNLAITVHEVRSDAVLLGVQYSRVVYEHDLAGRRLKFDSANHEGAIPWDAVPYAGMVNNGFAFWIGRDNQIRGLVGYQEFLERCVAEVPLERRQTLLTELSQRFGDDGVANFVDDSIGLLPYDGTVDEEAASRVLPGDVWTRERRLMQPVPVYLKSTYTLTDIDRETARIEITGRIASGEAVNAAGDSRVRISDGRTLGHCIVDRNTGLPLDVQIARHLVIHVQTDDGHDVIQEKDIQTTIRGFPQSRTQDPSASVTDDRGVSRGSSEAGTDTAAGVSSRARYPE